VAESDRRESLIPSVHNTCSCKALITKALDAIRTKAAKAAISIALPSDLHHQVVATLKRQPDIPWDLAVANIARRALQ
jgi:hypothetical protein